MKRLQAFQYELRPNGQQQRQMRRFAGSCRFVFNKALALQQERHQAGEKKLGYAALCKLLVQWKAQPETHWLSQTTGLEWRLLLAVPPHNTSRTCPCGGHVSQDNRKTQAQFQCVECRHTENADVVGAINVLERGHRLLACGEAVSRAKPKTERLKAKRAASAKQESTEATGVGVALALSAVGISVL